MVLTLELPDSLRVELEKRAQQVGTSLSEYVIDELQRLQPAIGAESGMETHPLIKLANRVRTELPADEALDLPSDFARNHDHYIHGAVRQSQ